MCLAVPVQVTEVDIVKGIAKVSSMGVKVQVSTSLFPDVVVGDFVLVHAGFIIEKLSPESAKEVLATFEEVEKNEKK